LLSRFREIHVQQKVALFMGDRPSFFQKAVFEKVCNFFDLINRMIPGTHGACVDSVLDPSQARATAVEFWILRSSLALAIEKVVIWRWFQVSFIERMRICLNFMERWRLRGYVQD
jgi:hypothetical protein